MSVLLWCSFSQRLIRLWRTMAEHRAYIAEVIGSNPFPPTKIKLFTEQRTKRAAAGRAKRLDFFQDFLIKMSALLWCSFSQRLIRLWRTMAEHRAYIAEVIGSNPFPPTRTRFSIFGKLFMLGIKYRFLNRLSLCNFPTD